MRLFVRGDTAKKLDNFRHKSLNEWNDESEKKSGRGKKKRKKFRNRVANGDRFNNFFFGKQVKLPSDMGLDRQCC